MLAETICECVFCKPGQSSIYRGDAAEIFWKLDMIMIICWLIWDVMIIEDIRNWDRYNFSRKVLVYFEAEIKAISGVQIVENQGGESEWVKDEILEVK